MFTKKDIQNGDIVVYRNGFARIVLAGKLFALNSESDLHVYNDDLTERFNCRTYDIVKVYRANAVSLMKYEDKEPVYDRSKIEKTTLKKTCKRTRSQCKNCKRKMKFNPFESM